VFIRLADPLQRRHHITNGCTPQRRHSHSKLLYLLKLFGSGATVAAVPRDVGHALACSRGCGPLQQELNEPVARHRSRDIHHTSHVTRHTSHFTRHEPVAFERAAAPGSGYQVLMRAVLGHCQKQHGQRLLQCTNNITTCTLKPA
jgi:hypothetical protein